MGVRDGSEATCGGGEGSPARQSGKRSLLRPGLVSLPSPELPRRDDSRKLAWREDGTLQGGSLLGRDQRQDDAQQLQRRLTEGSRVRMAGRLPPACLCHVFILRKAVCMTF